MPLPMAVLVVAVLLLTFPPPRLYCGLKMLETNRPSWNVLPLPRMNSPNHPPIVVVLLLPLSIETLLAVELLLRFPPILHCGLKMLPENNES